jgi:hypothetical protein
VQEATVRAKRSIQQNGYRQQRLDKHERSEDLVSSKQAFDAQ